MQGANANALSHCQVEPQKLNVTATLLDTREADLQTAQQHDPNTTKIYNQLTTSPRQPTGNAWKLQPLKGYKQICDQACENRAYLHTNFASFFKL